MFEELLLSFVRMTVFVPVLLDDLRRQGWDLRRARLGARAWRFACDKKKS